MPTIDALALRVTPFPAGVGPAAPLKRISILPAGQPKNAIPVVIDGDSGQTVPRRAMRHRHPDGETEPDAHDAEQPVPATAATRHMTVRMTSQRPTSDAVTGHGGPSPEHLFVYGTLRPRLATGLVRELIAHFQPAGSATVRGLLYDLGSYPGLVPGAGIVHGDLLRITNPGHLAVVDDYEECGGESPLYRREPITACRADGSRVVSWTYFYNGSVDGLTPLPGGDYAAHGGRFEGDT